jgi:hypothetical protein
MYGLSEKYVSLVNVDNGMKQYIGSWYSYFFILLFLISIFGVLELKIKWKRIFKFIVSCFIFVLILSTQKENKNFADMYEHNNIRYKMFEAAITSNYFSFVPDDAVIYCPEYTGPHNNLDYLSRYMKVKTNKTIHFIHNVEELKFQQPTYYMKYFESSKAIVLSQLTSDLMCHQLYVMPYVDFQSISIIGTQRDVNQIIVPFNDAKSGVYGLEFLITFAAPKSGLMIEAENVRALDLQVIKNPNDIILGKIY